MASTEKDQPANSDRPAPEPPGDEQEQVVVSQWEFIDRIPTHEDVLYLLNTLDPVWGIETVDFADYVQALPQRKKVKKPHPTNPNVMVDDRIDAYTLYMSVAGRMKMMEAAAFRHGWRVDFDPEPTTPTGAPGMLQMGDGRIVYREYVRIYETSPDGEEHRPLGSKPGTAWVPHSGGDNAAGSNPYEKVETSARGRALAAWGFGVFPGSGVASLEEMQGMSQNRAAMQEQGGNQQWGGQKQRRRMSREDLMGKALTAVEEFRQRRNVSEEQMNDEMVRYLTGLGVRQADNGDGTVNWENVKDGQLQLVANKMEEHLREMFAQEWTGGA